MKRIIAFAVVTLLSTTAHAAWEYDEQADAMGRGGVKTAVVHSNNTIDLGFPYKGAQYAGLIIRKHPKHGKSIILFIERGQLICDYDDCAITARFDDNKPTRVSASKPADHSSTAFFLSGFDRFVASAKKAKLLRIEVTFYQRGSEVLEFDISGLKWP